MSEKRPETDADIITRSRVLSGRVIDGRESVANAQKYCLDLPAHMAECDANYLRLMKLFPQMRTADSRSFALHIGEHRSVVELTVTERGPYTTLVTLQQETSQTWAAAPTIQMRVYHDAKSAEVAQIENQNRFHGVYDYPNKHMRQRDEKVQINRFLGEFLALCLEHGVSTQRVITRPPT